MQFLWAPKTLFARLMLSASVTMVGLVIVVTYLGINNDLDNQLDSLKRQSQAMAYQVAASSTSHIITQNYAELEELAVRFLKYPNVNHIYIFDADLNPLSAVKKQHNGSDYELIIDAEMTRPDNWSEALIDHNAIQVWQPIELGKPIAWVFMEVSLREYYQQRRSHYTSNILLVSMIAIIAIGIAYFVLRKNVNAIESASHFALNLLEQNDKPLSVKSDLKEVNDLIGSLNTVSTELEKRSQIVKESQALLETIQDAQTSFIADQDVHELFTNMLDGLLQLTGSEYGFIGEIKKDKDDQPYLKTHAITDISWNADTKKLYADNAESGFEFHNLDTLFGEVITSKMALITNDPANHPRSAGIPSGHPALKAFMGIPIFSAHTMVGMIGIANREQGYSQDMLDYLKPLLSTCGQIIMGYENNQKRSEAEAAVISSETMLRQVLNHIPTRVFWKDLNGVYLGCNYNFAQDAGFVDEQSLIGKNDYEMPWSSEAALYRHDDKEVINSGIPKLGYEEPQTTPEGETIWLRTNKIPLTDANNEVIGILGSYEDITTEKLQKQQLQKSEGRLADAQRIAHIGSWETDFRDGSNSWSEETYHILGLDPQTAVPSMDRFIECIHPADKDEIMAKILGHQVNKESYDYEARIITADNEERTIFTRVVFELTDSGDIARVFGTLQDITERKRMERMKDEFISTVSHELRTPLTSIKGSLGLVKGMATEALPESISSLLKIAENNTERLLFLINDILDISKIETGHIAFHFKPSNVYDFIKEAVNDTESYDKDVHLQAVSTETAPVWINADHDRFMQVLYNLISNAVKFSDPGDHVDIGIEFDDQTVSVYVRDYGRGIPEEYRSTIFDKFTQVDSSDTRNTGGTGLGLSITKTIMERHNGHVDFESEEGKGTTFTVTLPRYHVADGTDAQGGGMRVLICEDEPDVATLIQRMLVAEGYACDIAPNADAARQMLEAGYYQAMTLDIMLPGKDGISFLQEVRAEPRFSDLQVIIVSVKADEMHRQLEGGALNIRDWLSKPINETRLIATLEAIDQEQNKGQAEILHIEDDQDLVEVVRSMLHETAQVTNAVTLASARELLGSKQFDLILLDINLPDGSGLSIIEELKAQDIPTPIVVFSSEEVDEYVLNEVSASLLKSRIDNFRLLDTIQGVMESTDK
ncbi:MAG: response regulator [Gammaproteobacteria bacterium]|nr:response regulator [Gammaproteobacteria bacterium]